MKFSAFVEDSKGTVIGYAVEGRPDVILPKEHQFPRRMQKSRAELAAGTVGVELPAAVNKALKDLPDEVEAPRTAELGLE